jgi:uncharacterized protein
VILYYDTSALIKLLITEEGSDLARKLWGSASTAASSILAYPEGCAALSAAHGSGRLRPRSLERSLKTFETVHESLLTIGVDERLAQAAGRHAAEFGLRGYDAVHLATALDLFEEEVVFVTWDEDLARAADSAGLAVAGSSGW